MRENNDDCQVQEINNLFVITSKEKSCIIPHRAIEPDLLAEVSAIMLSVGMKNNEDEFWYVWIIIRKGQFYYG